jgi:hypothetical protein
MDVMSVMSELLIYLKMEQRGVRFHLENSYISQSWAQQVGEKILNSNLKEEEIPKCNNNLWATPRWNLICIFTKFLLIGT